MLRPDGNKLEIIYGNNGRSKVYVDGTEIKTVVAYDFSSKSDIGAINGDTEYPEEMTISFIPSEVVIRREDD